MDFSTNKELKIGDLVYAVYYDRIEEGIILNSLASIRDSSLAEIVHVAKMPSNSRELIFFKTYEEAYNELLRKIRKRISETADMLIKDKEINVALTEYQNVVETVICNKPNHSYIIASYPEETRPAIIIKLYSSYPDNDLSKSAISFEACYELGKLDEIEELIKTLESKIPSKNKKILLLEHWRENGYLGNTYALLKFAFDYYKEKTVEENLKETTERKSEAIDKNS